MRTPSRSTSPWQIAMAAAIFLAVMQAAMFESRAQTPKGEPKPEVVAVKAVAQPIKPLETAIEQVRVTRKEEQTEVRVEGSGPLYCVPFVLTGPDRLVLDFPGAAMRIQRPVVQGDVRPVRSVRFSQFKAVMARLVIDLDGRASYRVVSKENAVTVTFGSAAEAIPAVATKSEKKSYVVGVTASGTTPPPPPPAQAQSKTETKPPLGISTNPVSAPSNSAAKDEKKPAIGATAATAATEQKRAVAVGAFPSATPVLPLSTTPAPSQVSIAPPAEQQSVHDQSHSSTAPSSSLAASGESSSAKSISLLQHGTPQRSEASTISPAMENDSYLLGPLDVVAINVWRDPELSRVEPVRPDGKISLPLIGDMQASGLTPKMLQAQISKALEDYVRKPEVTVILQEANSHRFNLIGEVARPGSYLLASNMTVLDALAAGGGFRDFAKVTRIYVLRKALNGTPERIPFNYKKAIKGSRDMNLQLLPGDTIVVP